MVPTSKDINSKIYTIRDISVMIDSDLAKLYGVQTKVLNQAVKRNLKRFPDDFMFQLSEDELEKLRSQNVTTKFIMTRTRPFVFTEQGIAMLSSVLKSDTSIKINIQIMRTFVESRRYALTHDELAHKIQSLDKRVQKGEEVDTRLMEILTELIKKQNTINELSHSKTQDKIGFLKGE